MQNARPTIPMNSYTA